MKVTKRNDDGTIKSYDKENELVVGPMEFPFTFMTYKFDYPGLISGRDPDAGINIEVLCRMDETEARKFMPGDKDGFRIAPMNVEAYCRMLSKIAHSYAAAELGARSFKPTLTEFIRGRPLKQAWHWIGSDTAVPKPEPHLHDIQWLAPTINGTNW